MMRNIPLPFLMEETTDRIARPSRRAGLKFRPVKIGLRDAQPHWPAIEEHKWFLSERLGRDVGSEVAAVDYLENIARISTKAQQAKAGFVGLPARLSSVADRLLEQEGWSSFVNLQASLRGVPGSAMPSAISPRPHREFRELYVPGELAAKHARAIERNKWFVSERLGRDLGMRAAALDYFLNVRPQDIRNTFAVRLFQLLDRLLETSGPNSIANLETAMRQRTATVR